MSTKTAGRHAALEMGTDQFRRLGHRLIDQIADRLDALPDGPVAKGESPQMVKQALGASRPLPAAGGDPEAILAAAVETVFEHSVFNGHPRFLGYITSSPAPIGILGDLLAAASNQNVGGWKLAPMASEIEAQTVRWIAELIGYPTSAGGLLVSGGNMANFVCFLAARAAKAGWDVRKEGLDSGPRRMLMYASAETHTWIQKAADLFGFGTDAIRWIPVDDRQRMKLADLRMKIQSDTNNGDQPFLVVGTAGSVMTGAVDELPQLASLCREHNLWFHVDGAYGAMAAQVPEAPDDLRGLSLADSVAVDPHKWLYAPLEAGCALVRDAKALRDAFLYRPPYYVFNEEAINYVDYGPQNSRGFRALKVWLALQQVGRAGYLEMIGDDMRLSRELYDRLERHPNFEAATNALSITTFRYVPDALKPGVGTPEGEEKLNRLNQELMERIENSGVAFITNAVIDGKFLLRACIVNFRTTSEDLARVVEVCERLGRELSA
jgi:glutamate/tyrosine decarboxylase-like PLP-dependent enzyme